MDSDVTVELRDLVCEARVLSVVSMLRAGPKGDCVTIDGLDRPHRIARNRARSLGVVIASPSLDIVRRSPFFGSLPKEVFNFITERSEIVDLDGGQTLFNQGELSDAVFCVVAGLIKLTRHQSDGDEAVIDVFQPGQSFAEALAFRADRYPASAVSLVNSSVFVAPSSVVQTAIQNNPEAFPAILAGAYAHLHQLVHQIESLKANSSLERLARYIIAATESSRDSDAAELPFEKQVLASLLGMKPETLSRQFKRLEPHGVVLNRRHIILRDRKALMRLLEPRRS